MKGHILTNDRTPVIFAGRRSGGRIIFEIIGRLMIMMIIVIQKTSCVLLQCDLFGNDTGVSHVSGGDVTRTSGRPVLLETNERLTGTALLHSFFVTVPLAFHCRLEKVAHKPHCPVRPFKIQLSPLKKITSSV